MPTYDFKCNKCDHEFTISCSVSTREEALYEPCPQCLTLNSVSRYYANQHFELSDVWRLGYKKPDREWREFLGRMEAANPGSSINSQL